VRREIVIAEKDIDKRYTGISAVNYMRHPQVEDL
jgi:hypothetical protein